MKVKRKEFDIFSLSFLDIISCGFGAVVLLVLISNVAEERAKTVSGEAASLEKELRVQEERVDSLTAELERQRSIYHRQLEEQKSLSYGMEKLLSQEQQAKKKEQRLNSDLKGLSLVQSTLLKVSLATPSRVTVRDQEVGGIPVDSDYVVFIVDTSGSMQTIWGRVSKEIVAVLRIHPKVKGFQILNDQGKPLIPGYRGRFIPDSQERRKNVMRVFASWKDASNSSPVEGVEKALRVYARPGQATAIYVFGDDYTGGSFDSVIGDITGMNRISGSRRPLAKIHGVAFLSKYSTGRFGILMRELCKRNGGTFIALPL